MTTNTTPGILDGVRIVDLSDGIAGPIATLLLAEAGADVVMVEPPGGKSTRPLPGFRTWGRSKRSVVLDVDTAEGRATLEQLLAAALQKISRRNAGFKGVGEDYHRGAGSQLILRTALQHRRFLVEA